MGVAMVFAGSLALVLWENLAWMSPPLIPLIWAAASWLVIAGMVAVLSGVVALGRLLKDRDTGPSGRSRPAPDEG